MSNAAMVPGVLAIFGGGDVDLEPLAPALPMMNSAMVRPLLAGEQVRFVGEPVAAVVTERPDQGLEAAVCVWIDYEELPGVADPVSAERVDVLLHPDAGTNCAFGVQLRQQRR